MKYCTHCNEKYQDTVSYCPLDGEVLEDDPTSLVGSVLDGQYQIEALLGKGGMGAVYLARHILLGDRVAVKVLPPQMRNNAEWLRRFRREGQAARRFRHPNAVTVYDLRTTSDGIIYLVMEYVQGHTLDVEMKEHGRFSPEAAFVILEPIMGVLNAAHATGVIHRDLKPENIMIGDPVDGKRIVKLLDLGIAKIQDIAGSSGTSTNLTVAGQVLGTPYYMSPEQWGEPSRDGGSDIDGRTDIYSIGAVLYEVIAGHRPFGAKTLQDLRREHVSVMPRPLHEVFPDVPEAFSRSIERAMSKDRGDRPSTAGELADELRRALDLPSVSSVFDFSARQPAHALSQNGSHTFDYVTNAESEGLQTNSDVSAATLLINDSAGTSAGRARPSPQPVLAEEAAGRVDFQRESPASALQSPATPPGATRKAEVAPPAKSGKRLILSVSAGLITLLLIGVALAGFLYWRGINHRQPGVAVVTPRVPAPGVSNQPPASNLPAARDVLRYWLEVKGSGNQSIRMGGSPVLKSGQSFRFHVVASEDGYLYILGQGQNNKPYPFLTAKPVAMSGLKTNKVAARNDFSFPSGNGNWITLDKKTGMEKYIFIFSPTPLASPAFLTEAPKEKPLGASEEKELEGLRKNTGTSPVSNDGAETGRSAPFVSVKTTAKGEQAQPTVFDVVIEHQ